MVRSGLSYANVLAASWPCSSRWATYSWAGLKLKPNSVNSKIVKNDSLTGQDLQEGSLAQVPSAGHGRRGRSNRRRARRPCRQLPGPLPPRP